jgi:hypothetical protein
MDYPLLQDSFDQILTYYTSFDPTRCTLITAKIHHKQSDVRRTVVSALRREYEVRHGFIRRPTGQEVDVAIILTQIDSTQEKVHHILQYLARAWDVSREFVDIEKNNFSFAYLLQHPFLIIKSQQQGTQESDEDFDMLSVDGWELKSSDPIPDDAPRDALG